MGGIEKYADGVRLGHARVFEWSDAANAWRQRGADLVGDADEDGAPPYFGSSVALSDDGAPLAVGAEWSHGSSAHAQARSCLPLLRRKRRSGGVHYAVH